MPRQVKIKDRIIREKVAFALMEQCQKLGKTREQMAKHLDMSLKTLDNILDKKSITITNMFKILAKFPYDPHKFLDEK
jgi:plasmid maintenance system antidote protein VapI